MYLSRDNYERLYQGLRPYNTRPDRPYEGSFARMAEWSNHIQQASISIFKPGTNISVDEAIADFQGRSRETVTVPTKPTPTGFKLWVVAQRGYFLQWLEHRPDQPFDSAAGKVTRKRKRQDQYGLNPTQAVVVALVSRLPAASYHVFVDNLFSTPKLFAALRRQQIGATGTCRINSGIHKDLVIWKRQDNAGKLDRDWGWIQNIPTPDGQVNQIAWKDNALVLFLSTVYTSHEVQVRTRKRPTTTNPRARPIQRFFGAQPVKELAVPSISAEYNDYMNGVDIGDQLRTEEGLDHRICKGPWRALAWGFLLDVCIANSFLLQLWKRPSPWPPYKTIHSWRQQLCDEIFKKYSQEAALRDRNRPGDVFTPISQHKRVSRGKKGPCLACKGVRFDDQRPRATPLGQSRANSLNQRRHYSRSGCGTCNVALCNSAVCWDFYHRLK